MRYNGTTHVTRSGFVCQKWNTDTPHQRYENARNLDNFPDSSLEQAMNYCRNPTSSLSPWCYTTQADKVWEYCQIPKCESK